jgi:hypothetical protein
VADEGSVYNKLARMHDDPASTATRLSVASLVRA